MFSSSKFSRSLIPAMLACSMLAACDDEAPVDLDLPADELAALEAEYNLEPIEPWDDTGEVEDDELTEDELTEVIDEVAPPPPIPCDPPLGGLGYQAPELDPDDEAEEDPVPPAPLEIDAPEILDEDDDDSDDDDEEDDEDGDDAELR